MLDDTPIQEVKNPTFLGLTIDNRLSWDDYVNTLSNKLTSGNFALYRMSKVF